MVLRVDGRDPRIGPPIHSTGRIRLATPSTTYLAPRSDLHRAAPRDSIGRSGREEARLWHEVRDFELEGSHRRNTRSQHHDPHRC